MNIPVKFGKNPVSVSEEKFFTEKVYGRTHGRTDGRTHDGHNAMTIARWPSASGAKNETSPVICSVSDPFHQSPLKKLGENEKFAPNKQFFLCKNFLSFSPNCDYRLQNF